MTATRAVTAVTAVTAVWRQPYVNFPATLVLEYPKAAAARTRGVSTFFVYPLESAQKKIAF